MDVLLESKTAIVYGAGGGIGGGVARTFAREGATVFLTGRTREPLDKVADDITVATEVFMRYLAAELGAGGRDLDGRGGRDPHQGEAGGGGWRGVGRPRGPGADAGGGDHAAAGAPAGAGRRGGGVPGLRPGRRHDRHRHQRHRGLLPV
jgi:hypothetical protein